MLVDFSKCKLSGIYYGGSEYKIGIIYENQPYMLKFQKIDRFKKHFNHVSEFLGSHIFELLGFDSHKTILGIYNNKEVVACKDFSKEGSFFVPFIDVGESSLDTSKYKYKYSYDDIVTLLKNNNKLEDIDKTIDTFFEIYIVDALIGNFDRHGGNWGFIKNENKYYLSKVFDNGSTLFPSLSDDLDIEEILKSKEEINKRVYEFPTSQIKIDDKKSSYYDVISSLKYERINKALIKIYKRINLEAINNLIDSIDISIVRKKFYKRIIKERYEKIIKYSYDKLMEKENEK